MVLSVLIFVVSPAYVSTMKVIKIQNLNAFRQILSFKKANKKISNKQ